MASRTRWCFLSGLENGIPVLSIQREREGEGRREICEGTLHQSKGEYKLIVSLMVTISTLSSGDGRAGRAMTNMKHLSPTPPTGHLTPGQKEGHNYHQMVQEKWLEKCPKHEYSSLFYPLHPHKAPTMTRCPPGNIWLLFRSGLLFI